MKKLNDLFRTPKSRVLILVIALVLGSALFFGTGLLGRGKRSRTSSASPIKGFDVSVGESRKLSGFVGSYGPRIKDTERGLIASDAEVKSLQSRMNEQKTLMDNQKDELEAMKAELEALRAREISIDERVPQVDPISPEREAPKAVPEPAGAVYGYSPHPDDPPLPRIAKLTLAPRSANRSRSARNVIIPAGSFAEATLLTGLYAPVNDGAQPVQMRIDLNFIGPNKTRIPIQGAFLIGKAVGEANSLRVVIQLDTLSYVRQNGEVIEVPVNGYVTDQDGVMGLAGQYVWRIKEAATLAVLTGGISAAADAAAQKETTTLVNPLGGVAEAVTGDVGKFALARGASRASDEVGRIVTERLRDVEPAIYVANGKKLTVILLEGITLDGLRPDELGNEASRSPYAGLDLDR